MQVYIIMTFWRNDYVYVHTVKIIIKLHMVHVIKLNIWQISYPKLSLRLDPKLERLDVTLSLF